MGATLPDLQAGLSLDAFYRAGRDVFFWVWNGHSIRPIRMPKLMMASFHADEAPSRSLELANNRPAVHADMHDVHQGAAGQVTAGGEALP